MFVWTLAWDPGPTKSAYALVEVAGRGEMARHRYHSCGMVESTASAMLEIVEGYAKQKMVDVVAIEHAVHTHPSKTASRAALMGRAKQLMATTRIEGIIETLCVAKGLPVRPLPATVWRRELTGRAQATDARVKEHVSMVVSRLPKRTNVHVRDAIGLAVVAGHVFSYGPF
jgi:Holliday junction resolvasome RuvABC endonuclease subunit